VRTAGSPELALGRSPVSRAGVGTAEEAGAGEAGVITRGDGDRESSSTEKLLCTAEVKCSSAQTQCILVKSKRSTFIKRVITVTYALMF
jgi:hypothetical protein